jgi:heptaprenyl diphosphate synthase
VCPGKAAARAGGDAANVSPERLGISAAIRASEGRKRVYYAAFLATLAIFMAIAESIIPRPLPWLRLGLANAVTLYAFGVLRPKEVLLVVLCRTVASSLLLGTFLSVSFVLSLTGALTSFAVMLLMYRGLRRWVSLVGISIVGAVTSNAAQLFVVNALFVGSRLSMYLLPFLFLFALVGGTVSGLFGRFLTENL